jgi:hypothetical protein
MRSALLLALALTLAACGGDADAPATGDAADPDAAASDAPASLACAPATLAPGDTLRIDLPAPPRGGDLAVVGPDGTYHFAYRAGTAHPLFTPAPTGSLPALTTLTLPVDATEMKPFAYDAQTSVAVFGTPGAYRVLLGDGLLPDDAGSPSHACTVTVEGA